MRCGRAAEEAPGVAQAVADQRGEAPDSPVPVHRQQRGEAVGRRRHRDDGRDPPVGDGDGEDVPAGVRRAPEHDPVRVDAVEPPGRVDRGVVVGALAAERDALAGSAVRGTEAAVVEQQDVEAGGREALGVPEEPGVAGAAEAVRHDDAGPAVSLAKASPAGQVPGRAGDAALRKVTSRMSAHLDGAGASLRTRPGRRRPGPRAASWSPARSASAPSRGPCEPWRGRVSLARWT